MPLLTCQSDVWTKSMIASFIPSENISTSSINRILSHRSYLHCWQPAYFEINPVTFNKILQRTVSTVSLRSLFKNSHCELHAKQKSHSPSYVSVAGIGWTSSRSSGTNATGSPLMVYFLLSHPVPLKIILLLWSLRSSCPKVWCALHTNSKSLFTSLLEVKVYLN